MDTIAQLQILSPILMKTIQDVILHPVSLELIWNERPSSDFDLLLLKQINDSTTESISFIINEYKLEGLNILSPVIHSFGWDAVVLPKSKLVIFTKQELEIKNGNGIFVSKFKDSDFVYEIENLTGITLKNITEACYRLKTLKFNFWNETILKLNLIEETENGYKLQLIFNID